MQEKRIKLWMKSISFLISCEFSEEINFFIFYFSLT